MSQRAKNITLWVVQLLLAYAYLNAGYMKLFMAPEPLGEAIYWTKDVPFALVRFIGLSELLAGVGFILPAALRVMPKLTVWAGVGIAVVMASATVFHIVRGEFAALPITLPLMGLAIFVAWGRTKLVPIAPRSGAPVQAN